MKRYLIQQMANEWRSNVWMVVEMAIVAVILWILFSFFANIYSIRTQDYGYDTNNVVAGFIEVIENGSDDMEKNRINRDNLILNLRQNPYVESIGIGKNSLTYQFNLYAAGIKAAGDTSILTIYGNQRYITPEMIEVMRIKSIDGKTTRQLAEVISNGGVLIGDMTDGYNWFGGETDMTRFLNRNVYIDGDSSRTYFVGGMAKSLHRSDYEQVGVPALYRPMPPELISSDIAIRVKEGTSMKFMESLKKSDLKLGDVYITGLTDLNEMGHRANLEMDNLIRNSAVCAGFMMLVVFLGFLGTFWFRTQQRSAEIAIRKVNGATSADIFRRLVSEGLFMLVIALFVAAGLSILLIKADWIPSLYNDIRTSDIVSGAILTISALVIMIMAGIIFPARMAMAVNAAEALKEQ